MAAEANIALGNVQKVTEWCMSGIFGSSTIEPGATGDAVANFVKGLWTGWDDGMKIINQVRWGNTESWGHRALLPIPIQVLSANENLTQNPGWN